jgi:hypothetical protein
MASLSTSETYTSALRSAFSATTDVMRQQMLPVMSDFINVATSLENVNDSKLLINVSELECKIGLSSKRIDNQLRDQLRAQLRAAAQEFNGKLSAVMRSVFSSKKRSLKNEMDAAPSLAKTAFFSSFNHLIGANNDNAGTAAAAAEAFWQAEEQQLLNSINTMAEKMVDSKAKKREATHAAKEQADLVRKERKRTRKSRKQHLLPREPSENSSNQHGSALSEARKAVKRAAQIESAASASVSLPPLIANASAPQVQRATVSSSTSAEVPPRLSPALPLPSAEPTRSPLSQHPAQVPFTPTRPTATFHGVSVLPVGGQGARPSIAPLSRSLNSIAIRSASSRPSQSAPHHLPAAGAASSASLYHSERSLSSTSPHPPHSAQLRHV